MPTFLHAADIHLDSQLHGLERYEGAPVDAIREATRRAFKNLVLAAIDRKVAFLLLVGDLYDGDWKDYRTGLFFNRQMSRLREAGVPVIVVSGNHDAASQLTKHLNPPANVHFLDTKAPETLVLEALRVALHGQGYASRVVKDDLSAAYPAPIPGLLNVGLLHTSVDGREGHEPYAPCTLEGLQNRGYAYWALGHVHAREVLAEDPWIVFPGNLQGRHAKETGPKGATLVEYEGDVILDVEAATASVPATVAPLVTDPPTAAPSPTAVDDDTATMVGRILPVGCGMFWTQDEHDLVLYRTVSHDTAKSAM